MKKTLTMVLVFVMMLGLCACTDAPQATEPSFVCDTEHIWTDATCKAPKTCTVCATTEGEALAHRYKRGVCTVCKSKDPKGDPLMNGAWMYITKDQWDLFMFYPDGTCSVTQYYGRPVADYDMEKCVKSAAASLQKQYGDLWEEQASSEYHVVKILDYYYVVQMKTHADSYTIEGDIITIGTIPPVKHLIIINDQVLENGENDNRFIKLEVTYISDLWRKYNELK